MAQDAPNAAIVFDSTYSMWGQIKGKNKVVSVREALANAFKPLDGKVRMGLVTYGGDSGGCSSVTPVRPMGTLDAGGYADAVAKAGPSKGPSPVSKALEQAAEMADFEVRPTSIVLIADGLDNCQADPCAMAQTLRSRATHLRIHVIAFDQLRERELKGLACVAEETGGSFHSATDRATLEAALGTVMSQVTAYQGASRPGAQAKAMSPTLTPADQVKEAAQSRENGKPVVQAKAGTQAVPAPPMKPTGAEQDKEAGQAKETGTRETGSAAQPAAAEQVLQQVARQTGPASVSLRLAASLTEDSGLLSDGVVWRVFSSTPDAEGNFRVVARKDDAEGVFALKPGDYIVHVAYGRANATKEIKLASTDHEETIVLNAGGLRLSAAVPGGTSIPEEAVSYAVYSSEQDQFGQRKLILPSVPQGKIVRLNAGRYHVVSQFGDANAVVRADVEVKAGQLSDALVNHEAARVTFKLVNEPGGEALANTSWSILSAEGEVVSESVGAFPSHILAAGDYSVVARHEGRAFNKTFAVQTGLNTELELVAQ